ncbi:MAG TPA: hypothetical protein VL461_04025 [Dictyobacter sp.]|nr:hypothetical protein [Dictyobacter sp.]
MAKYNLQPGQVVRVLDGRIERQAKIVQYPYRPDYAENPYWAKVEYLGGERDGECEAVALAYVAWLPEHQQKFDDWYASFTKLDATSMDRVQEDKGPDASA